MHQVRLGLTVQDFRYKESIRDLPLLLSEGDEGHQDDRRGYGVRLQ